LAVVFDMMAFDARPAQEFRGGARVSVMLTCRAAGVTLRPTGTAPLVIKSRTPIVLYGTIDVSGQDGTSATLAGNGISGVGVAGGWNGGRIPGPLYAPYSVSDYQTYDGSAGAGPYGGRAGCAAGCTATGGDATSRNAAPTTYSAWHYSTNTDTTLATAATAGGSGGGSSSSTTTTRTSCGSRQYNAGGAGAGGGIVVLVAPGIRIAAGGSLDASGGLGGTGYDKAIGCGASGPDSSFRGGAGSGGSIWLRAASIDIDGALVPGDINRIDAREVSGSIPAGTIVGSTAGLPGLFGVQMTASGVISLTNNSAQSRAVKMVVTE
jgi:hypothetical protein